MVFLFVPDLLEAEDEDEEEEEETFHLLSLASSISICSCLHSWLQNGVFPLQKKIKKIVYIINIKFFHILKTKNQP